MMFIWRRWHRQPLHVALVAVLMALGIAANVLVFVFIESLLISPLAVEDPADLVSFGRLSYPNYQSLVKRLRGTVSVAAFVTREVTLTSFEEPALASFVSLNYFTTLGVRPLAGRMFALGDTRVAVLSEDLLPAMGSIASSAIGKTLWLNNTATTIIGVAPSSFRGTTLDHVPGIWVPISLYLSVRPDLVDLRDNRRVPWVSVFGRRDKGTSLHLLRANTRRLANHLATEYPYEVRSEDVQQVVPLAEEAWSPKRRAEFVQVFTLLQSAAFMVFVVGIASVCMLVLMRVEMRVADTAVALAHGARWWHISSQAVSDYSGLAVLSVAFAGGIAGAGFLALRMGSSIPEIGLGRYTITGSLALAVATPLVAGLIAGARARMCERGEVFQMSMPARRWSGRQIVHVLGSVQVALMVAIVSVEFLFVTNLSRKLEVDPGFNVAGVVCFRMSPSPLTPDAHGPTGNARRQLAADLSALSEVLGATWSTSIPFGGFAFLYDVAHGRGKTSLLVRGNHVDHNFFSTLQIPFLAGRTFLDGPSAYNEVVVNKKLADTLWPHSDAISQPLYVVEDRRLFEIVGVVGNVNYGGPSTDGAEPMVYFALNHAEASPAEHLSLRLRPPYSIEAFSSVRERIRQLTSRLIPYDVMTLSGLLDDMVFRDRMIVTAGGVFASLVLALSSLGMYAACVYLATWRRHETGIRYCLGATQGQLLMLMLWDGGTMLGVGALGGSAIAIMTVPVIESQVYGMTTADAMGASGAAMVLLLAVGMVAAGVPAWRAVCVWPAVTLRDIRRTGHGEKNTGVAK